MGKLKQEYTKAVGTNRRKVAQRARVVTIEADVLSTGTSQMIGCEDV